MALERAGLPAQPQRMNSALTYAGRQLEGTSKSSLKTDGIANNGIEMGMTDLERYAVLRGQSISLVDASNLISNDDLERYRHTSKNDIEKELRQMLTESNVLGDKQKGAALKNNYLNMQAFFSSRGLHESIERQSKGVSNLAALMPVFRETYQNAVPVLVQGNRYLYTSLNESDTESFAYLLGAFTYKDEIIPVQFELKKNANPEDNSVYVVATIEKDALITGKRDNSHLPTTASSNINIADLISYVKQNNERILANLPAQFLTEEQKAGKREGLIKKGNAVREKAEQGKSDADYALKLRIETHIDEAASVSQGKGNRQTDKKSHAFAGKGFDYRRAYFMDFDGKYYSFQISVGNDGVVNTIYNVNEIKEAELPNTLKGAHPQNANVGLTASDPSISTNGENVNAKFSLRSDEDGLGFL